MTTCSHMLCPFCSSKTRVYNSRSSHQATQTWRRRQCLKCSKTFTTREKVDFDGIVTVRSLKGSESPYSRDRLLLSLVNASNRLGLAPEVIGELTDSIELGLKEQRFFNHSPQSSDLITITATMVIQRYNKNFALQYINQIYDNKPPLDLIQQLSIG